MSDNMFAEILGCFAVIIAGLAFFVYEPAAGLGAVSAGYLASVLLRVYDE